MSTTIRTSIEGPRGCGHRKEGGLYLVADGPSAPCFRFPFPLPPCEHCGRDLNPVRGWTWFNPDAFCKPTDCGAGFCARCPLGGRLGQRVGLVWIGAEYYSTPELFLDEVRKHGLSRRIPKLPEGFEPGVTWVLFAHRFGIPGPQAPLFSDDTTGRPGVIFAARPRLEKVVSAKTTDAEAEALRDRGIEPVIVERAGEWPKGDA